MKRTVILMMIISLIGKVTGYLREAAMASSVGANILTDAYIYSLTISGLLTSVILTGFNTALLPVLSEAEKGGKKDVLFNRMISICLPIILVLVALVFVFTPQLLRVFAPGITDEIRVLTENYARILSINVLFQGVQGLLVGYLQKENRFLYPAAMALPLNFAIILGAFLSSPTNITPMVIATAVGQGLTLLWLLIPMRRTDFRFKWDFNWRDPYIKLFFMMIAPVMISMMATQTNLAVDRALASYLPDASASYLNYASKIQNLFNSVFVVSVATVLFKSQSEIASENDYKKVFSITKENLNYLFLFVVPVVVGLMFLSQEVIEVALMRRNFTMEDAIITGNILFFYSLLIFFYTINDMVWRMYFSMKETRKPVITTVITVVVNIVLNIILMRYFGVYGLAVATVIAAATGSIVLLIYIRRDRRFEGQSLLSKSLVQFIAGSVFMLGTLYLLKHYTPITKVPTIVYSAVIAVFGFLVYSAFLMIVKNHEFKEILMQVKARFGG